MRSNLSCSKRKDLVDLLSKHRYFIIFKNLSPLMISWKNFRTHVLDHKLRIGKPFADNVPLKMQQRYECSLIFYNANLLPSWISKWLQLAATYKITISLIQRRCLRSIIFSFGQIDKVNLIKIITTGLNSNRICISR